MAIPAALPRPTDKKSSTQEGFGKILNAIAAEDSELARRIVTTSPDVTVSTNLGAWVNRRGLFGHTEAEDVFRELKVVSAQLLAQDAAGASTSSSASPRTTCSSSSPRSASATRSSARGCCRSARSTTRSSPAASMR